MPQSEFLRSIEEAEKRMARAAAELARTKRLAEGGDMAGAFGTAFAFEAEIEKLTLLARAMPAYTGHPKAAELTEQLLEETIPVEMGYMESGCFCLRLPALLPKKGSGSPSYIRDFLYPAMKRFFAGKCPIQFHDCVLVFRHVYSEKRSERAYRDHDNIELNMVTDIVALYLMPDDSPLRCSHYYCSAVGSSDRTEVYLVPPYLFTSWLKAEATKELEEEKLYETWSAALEKNK